MTSKSEVPSFRPFEFTSEKNLAAVTVEKLRDQAFAKAFLRVLRKGPRYRYAFGTNAYYRLRAKADA